MMEEDILLELRAQIADAMKEDCVATASELLHAYPSLRADQGFYQFLYGLYLCKLGRRREGESELLIVDPACLPAGTRHQWEIATAQMYEESGRYDAAEKWFRQATTSNPE